MGNRATPPRSFNTIRQSQCKQRAKRETNRRIVLLAICATLILIFLALIILLICSIANAIGNAWGDQSDTGDQNHPNQPSSSIVYQQITKSKSDMGYGTLALINQTHKYNFPSSAERSLITVYAERSKVNGSNIYQLSSEAYRLNKETFQAFDTMMLKYYEISDGDGSTTITSAYRSYVDQDHLTSSSVQAGYSDHHSGYCLALDSDASDWIYENCAKYGFITRYPNNKSEQTGVSGYEECLRYVGVAHATYITANDLCLEEYVTLLRTNYDMNKHLQIIGADGNRYEVYYVSASDGDITTIRVPENYSYTVSGDNDSGFIVTINCSLPIDQE